MPTRLSPFLHLLINCLLIQSNHGSIALFPVKLLNVADLYFRNIGNFFGLFQKWLSLFPLYYSIKNSSLSQN